MDITSSPTSGAPPTKSPEPEPDTQNRTHQGKSFNFTNGVLKRHHSAAAAPVVYKECLKNHAASLGGHALDGCGEFMPSPSATADPTSLKCAACGCHRNFHRREPEDHFHPLTPTTHVIEYHPHHRHHPPPPPPPTQQPTRPAPHGGARSPSSQSPPPISSTYYPASAPHMLLALSGGNPVEQSAHHHHNMINSSPLGSSLGRKRFRTKFSQNQKDRMYEFAEKLGWRMQKSTDELVMKFCSEVGVERGVFKVWMHNNKSTYGKRSAADNSGGGGGGGEPQHGVDNGNNSSSNNNNDMEGHHHHQNHNIFSHGHYNSSSSKNVEGNVHNGSSSSS